MGNPFLDDFPELVTLDNRNCVDDSVTAALCALEDTGTTQYQDFVKKFIEGRSVSIHQPIKKIHLHFSKDLSQKLFLSKERSLKCFRIM